MKRWCWKQSPGAIRSALVLGVALVLTLGVIFALPLQSHNVIISDPAES